MPSYCHSEAITYIYVMNMCVWVSAIACSGYMCLPRPRNSGVSVIELSLSNNLRWNILNSTKVISPFEQSVHFSKKKKHKNKKRNKQKRTIYSQSIERNRAKDMTLVNYKTNIEKDNQIDMLCEHFHVHMCIIGTTNKDGYRSMALTSHCLFNVSLHPCSQLLESHWRALQHT